MRSIGSGEDSFSTMGSWDLSLVLGASSSMSMMMVSAVPSPGWEDVDVDGKGRDCRRCETSLSKYLDTTFSWKSSFRRFGGCPEEDALRALDEPALPSFWRASLLILLLYGFETNTYNNHGRSFYHKSGWQDGLTLPGV